MSKSIFSMIILMALLALSANAAMELERDIITTSKSDLEVTFIGHGSLMFTYKNIVIHVDPFSRVADYTQFPKANLILITHEHRDHLDPVALEAIRTERTWVILTQSCSAQVPGGVVMKNGDIETVGGLTIEAVPAYNLVHMRSEGIPYHPKGIGNGYVITFSDKRVYVAGDTENIPEMQNLKNIDIAFLPMNLPYTMTPEMVAEAANACKPKVLYPYHFGETDTDQLVELMKSSPEMEVRVRNMK